MIIEKAVLSDAEELLALQKLSFISQAELYNDYELLPLVQTIEQLREDFSRLYFLKAVEDGKIVGSVRSHTEDGVCMIMRLYVHPECQKSGIGSALMREIERVNSSSRIFTLFTGYKSIENIRLYEKLGYTIQKTKESPDGDDIHLVYMQKLNIRIDE